MSVLENLQIGALPAREKFEQQIAKVYEALPMLRGMLSRRAATLSGGQRQMLALGRGRWYDFWSDCTRDGARSVLVPAPLERMPLFVRAGAILPLGPAPARPDHRPAPTIEVLVYPDGDSRFTLYEDDGETQAWRQGAYAETVITCAANADEVAIVEPAAGDPTIIPADRRYRLRIRVPSSPARVTAGRQSRPLDRLCYHAEIPCGAWAAFKLARYLMTITGEARFGDWMEALLLNAMGAALPTQADGQTYYYGEYGIAGGRKQFYWHEWPCCSGTYLQNMAEYHNLVFFRDAEGLCVNLYVAAELRWIRDGTPITVKLETNYPEAPFACVTLDMADPAEFRLRFRIPGWCRDATLQVNGEPVDVAAAPGGWAAVQRLWSPGDRVTVALPMSLRTVPVDRQHPDRVAVMYGPVVLAQDEACCRRPLAIGRETRLSSRLVQDGPGLRFRLINSMPERHTRHLVPLYSLPAFWPYWIYFDLHAEALY